MNKAIGKLAMGPFGDMKAEIFNGEKWIRDNPLAALTPHSSLQTYSDFWGVRNFAEARLLTRDQVKDFTDLYVEGYPEAPLLLELRHTPSLSSAKPVLKGSARGALSLNPYKTLIPLSQSHLNTILDNMYTARIVIQNGYARRYSIEGGGINRSQDPYFPDVPDGTYEFYYGKAYKVGWGAITTLLEPSHPLYSKDPAHIQKLYNLGIEVNTAFSPHSPSQIYFPNRYSYFRDGDLYLLGAPLLKKGDPLLVQFLEKEEKKEKASTPEKPYVAFKDHGPPLKEGNYDKDFIRTFGFTVPSKQYFVLGDNHAMSSDSRIFGTIPEENLQGAPSLILWPPGERWGFPAQKPYPLFPLPRLVVWAIVLLCYAIWRVYTHYHLWKPLELNH